MRELLKRLSEEKVLPNAFDWGHEEDYLIGIWWYQLGTGICEYSTKAVNHSEFKYFPDISSEKEKGLDIVNRWARGRLIKKDHFVYLIVYVGMIDYQFTQAIISDIKYKVQHASKIRIDRVVDEDGYLLQERKE